MRMRLLQTYRLREHGLVIVLETIGNAEDGDEPSINLSNELLLFARFPFFTASICCQYLQCLVVVHGIHGDGLFKVVQRLCWLAMLVMLLYSLGLLHDAIRILEVEIELQPKDDVVVSESRTKENLKRACRLLKRSPKTNGNACLHMPRTLQLLCRCNNRAVPSMTGAGEARGANLGYARDNWVSQRDRLRNSSAESPCFGGSCESFTACCIPVRNAAIRTWLGQGV